MLPIIGLTTYGRTEEDFITTYYDSHFTLPDLYTDSVQRAGGIPLLIPPVQNISEATSLLSKLDGIIITGGTDIDPVHYAGNTQNPSLHPHDNERDSGELVLLKAALQMPQIPILCICRGAQLLNVVLGGTLYEHIPDVRAEDMHRSASGGWIVHEVTIEANSKLAHLMGTQIVHTYSGHHQALNQLGESLRITATASDEIIEAIEHTEHPWCVGVQWHPEKSAAEDVTQQQIFNALVKESSKVAL